MAATWHTTVSELMGAFRRALVALVPSMDAARIPWRPPNAYDDWEEIAACLYKNVVTRSISWSLPEPTRSAFRMDEYDPAATAPGVRAGALLVRHRSFVQPLVFRRLQTTAAPFDTVEAWDGSGTPIKVPFDEAAFTVVVGSAFTQKELEFIAVEL
jgi:hypothetical protein